MANDDLRSGALLKLFDTLKESQDNLQHAVDRQSNTITTLTSYLKEGVQLAEIKKIIEEHDKEASEKLEDLDSCTGTINTKSEALEKSNATIISLLASLKSRTDKVLITIGVAFALVVMSYFFVKSNVDSMIDTKIKASSVTMPSGYDTIGVDQQILKELKDIRDDIKRIHPEKK
jgi:DNA-binding transcriptional MerR regulator